MIRRRACGRVLGAPRSVRLAIGRPGVAWADSHERGADRGAERARDRRTRRGRRRRPRSRRRRAGSSPSRRAWRTASSSTARRTTRTPALVFSEIIEAFPDTPSLPGRALAARRDVLRVPRVPLGAPGLRGDRRRSRATLASSRTSAGRSRGSSTSRSASTISSGLDEVFAAPRPGAAGAGRRRAHVRQGEGLLRAAGLLERPAGVRVGPERDRVHPPGAVLPGPDRHEGHQQRERRVRRRAARRPGRLPRPRTTSLPSRRSASSPSSRPTPTTTSHVIDLAWMAIGRLFYEMEQYQQAADGVLEGRARVARVRHDALRARVGLRARRRRPARRARARGALGRGSDVAVHRRRDAAPRRSSPPRRAPSTSRSSSTRRSAPSTTRCA